ncbi:MAG TPA: glycosyl hydrolase [Acidothermaceae bacterium]|jgi:hypothetical protein
MSRTAPSIAQLRSGFEEPAAEARPMMRWWWFGPDVEEAELDKQLRAVATAGFAGVEVAYVYPLSEVAHPILSEGFAARLRFAAELARTLGLRFDLTLGSGWSFGGPHISVENAARQLICDLREVPGTALEVPVAARWPGDELVAAYLGDGSIQEPPSVYEELSVEGGVVRVPAGRSPRVVLLAWSQLTGQNVKRAAAGAEGPVLDHYSADAVRAHIAGFAEPLLDAVGDAPVGSVFCDSLEVYHSNWTPGFLDAFEELRGYNARPHLYQLVTDGPGAAEFRGDFHRTLTQLYEQNFVSQWRSWAASHGLPFRIQGYGTPPAAVSSYRFADLFEGEGWGWNGITATRWASSAAHIYDLDVVSSEVWTWAHSPSFRATPLDLKGEAHEHLLAGINQFIGHGWPYSPESAGPVGWIFYAAGVFDDRNPWWPAMPGLNRYLQRLSWLMRQGAPVNRAKLYVPVTDIYQRMGTGDVGLDLWRETERCVGDHIPRILHGHGVEFDLVDDDAIETLDAADVELVVVPFASAIPAATHAWLDRVAASGGAVVRVRHDDDADADSVTVEALAERLRATTPDYVIEPASPSVGVVHRRTDDADIYLVVNAGNLRCPLRFSPATDRLGFEVWDPATGTPTAAGALDGPIALDLAPYAALVVVVADDVAEKIASSGGTGGTVVSLDGPWTARFTGDADSQARAVTLPHRWEDERAGYSGSVVYETTFETDALAGGVLLDFGDVRPDDDSGSSARQGVRGKSYRARVWTPVREVAEVTVNDVPIGVVWAPPYAIDISSAVVFGTNRLKIVVSNTGSNALANDRQILDAVDESVARYGRRFRMQELGLALEGVSSGLLAAPRLRTG